MAELYAKRPVKVQKKSGFDKSFQNLFTSKVGTITPILCDEVIPNTTVNLKAAITAALPPLASDTFMRVKLKYAAFFVPTRILLPSGVYEDWLTGDSARTTYADPTGSTTVNLRLPVFSFNNTDTCTDGTKVGAPGTLADFLGAKLTSTETAGSTVAWNINVNALPFLAYHKIYNDWFRNALVQKDIFLNHPLGVMYTAASSNVVAPTDQTINSYTMEAGKKIIGNAGACVFADGVYLQDLRQANFDIDMYTSATPQAQNGAAQKVSFSLVDGNGTALTESNFTISALRAANSIQQWLERNNIAGNRMVDYVKAQYGANLSDYIAQRPVLLGSGQFDVYSKGIFQTTPENVNTGGSNNPFDAVGARYGSAYADGTDILIKGFTAQEPGYIMVVTWLSPKVTYSTGLNPMLTRYLTSQSQSDMANPILQNVGNEPIYARDISDKIGNHWSSIFGYQDRYYSWKDRIDEVHGILRDGDSLDSFALQRTFSSSTAPQISSSFLQIPTSYMDQVAAVTGDISQYGYWCDTYFDYKVSMPLARYSTPSLQDPAYEHGEDVIVNNRGTQLA